MENKEGPRLEPCSTPLETYRKEEVDPFEHSNVNQVCWRIRSTKFLMINSLENVTYHLLSI